jgi:hypothetical protein
MPVYAVRVHARGGHRVVATRAMARPARARQWLTCSVVGGVITRMVRGGHWARRMAARLTNGGRALMRWWMGRHGDISSRAAALRRALAMVARACSTGLSREVREADQLKKKRGVGSAHRKRMTRHGWWLSGPIPVRGGVPMLDHHLDGAKVLRRGGARAARI